MLVKLDAAMALFWLEACVETGASDDFDGFVEQAEVHAADELGVLAGEPVERAVAKHHGRRGTCPWLEAVLVEHVDDGLAPVRLSLGGRAAQL